MPLFMATLLPAAGGVQKITDNIKEHTNKNTNRESDYRAHFISVSDVTPGGSVPIKDIVNIPVIPDQNVFLHCQYVRPVFLILIVCSSCIC